MTIPVLVGPTSSGKTSLGLKLHAKNSNIEIISADSRQIYKHMDIGTGKLPRGSAHTISRNDGIWLIDDIRVWGYDVVNPSDYFSAYDFVVFARAKIADILQRGKLPIVIGGTGFFVDALTGKVSLSQTPPNAMLRKELNDTSLKDLLEQLKSLNEVDYLQVDQKNKVRVVRAIERNSHKEKAADMTTKWPFKYFGLHDMRSTLYARADKWAESIWGNPLFDEITKLVALGFKDCSPLKGLIYKTALAHMNNGISFSYGLERVQFDLHAYIRRQQTWFKKNPDITWLDASKSDANLDIIEQALSLS